MIQRIQSIYLLAIVVVNALLLTIPFGAHAQSGEDLLIQNNHFTLITVAASTLIAIYTILQFKNRPKQLKLVKMIGALIITFSVAAHMAVHESLFSFSIDALKETIRLGMIFPMISLVLAFLAHKAIKKDDQLVKSVDRLR